MAALSYADRIKETTSTSGTGTMTLAGAASGYRAFSVLGDGARCYYRVESGTDWEIGIGTYTSSGTTLSRTQILASTNSGSAITLSGTSTVYHDVPAVFFKDQVRHVHAKVAATANVTLATDCENGDTLNGVVLTTGDTIFLPYQSSAAEARVWVVKASGAPDPHPLMPTGDVISAFLVTVSEGTTEKDLIWLQTANTATVGTNSLTWSKVNAVSLSSVPQLPYQAHNLAVNSGFWFASMRKAASTATSYSDDTYGMDCWNILSQGSTALVSQGSTSTDYAAYYMRVQNNTGSSNRVGCCQIIEYLDSVPLRNQTVTFKCRLRCSETKNLRVSVVCSTQTADSVTSDSVGTWTSTTFTSGNFFANYGVGATVLTEQIACTANTWRDAVVTGTFLSTANNAVLVITCDDTLANNEKFDVQDVEFYLGSEVTTARPRRPFVEEQLRAARFAFVPIVPQEYVPGFKANTSQIYTQMYDFPVEMRADPTGVVTTSPTFNNGAASSSQIASYNRVAVGYTTITGALTVTAQSYSPKRGFLYLSAGTSFNGTVGDVQSLDFGSDFHAYFHAFL